MSNNLTVTRPDTPNDTDPATPAEAKRKLELSLTQIVGGALAAMTAAALGSTLGVGGTIIGAAFASIIAGVAGALYTASLRHTREKVKTVFTGRSAGSAAVPPPVRAPRPPRKTPWRRAVVITLAAFALAIVALTGFEYLIGHALSGGKGTTVEQVSKAKPATPTKAAKPTPTSSPSATPTPSVSPSAVPQTTPTLPVQPDPTTADPSGTATPSATPTPTVTPSSGVELPTG